MENKPLPQRMVNYDILRIFAAFLIVMLHLSVQYINKAPASVEDYMFWQQSIKLSVLSRVGVPIFIMLSGAFLLKPDKIIGLDSIFKRYLPKLLLIFIFWSFFYALAEQKFFQDFLSIGFANSWNNIDWDKFWLYFLQGHYHMWYLYMLAGLYLITPLLKHITAQATKIQLIYFVFFTVFITSVTKLNEELWHFSALEMVLNKLSLTFLFGYIGYFVAGYLFSAYTPRWRTSLVFFVLGVLSFRFTYQETWLLNPMFGFDKPNLIYFSNYAPTVFLMSFAVFLFTAKLKSIKIWEPLQRVISRLQKYTLVVYLVHPFVISQVRLTDFFIPIEASWSLLFNSLIVYVISFAVSILLMELYHLVFRLIKC